jgi:molybdenum cofactor biosynthesis protein B
MSGPGVAALPLTIAMATVGPGARDETDAAARHLASRAEASGHVVLSRIVVGADRDALDAQLRAWLASPAVDAIIVLGAVGIGPSDMTPEVIGALLDREAPGYGEEMRALGRRKLGIAALSWRAGAGIAEGAIVLAVPDAAMVMDEAWDTILGPALDIGVPGSLAALLPAMKAR